MPIKIQEGRTLSALLERFGIKGRHLLQLDEVVVPVVVVEDVRDVDQNVGPNEYIENIALTGAVGQSCVVRFQGGPNFRNLPLWIDVAPSANDRILMNFEAGAVEPVLTGAVTTRGVNIADPTGPPAPAPVQGGTLDMTAIGNRLGEWDVLALETYRIDLSGWKLRQDERLYIWRATQNAACTFTFGWSAERLD